MKHDKNLFARSTQVRILGLLRGGERCGAELIAALDAASCQIFRQREAFLYPLLHYLERKGLVRADVCECSSGRMRRCYGLTGKGRRRLARGSGSARRDGTLPSEKTGNARRDGTLPSEKKEALVGTAPCRPKKQETLVGTALCRPKKQETLVGTAPCRPANRRRTTKRRKRHENRQEPAVGQHLASGAESAEERGQVRL